MSVASHDFLQWTFCLWALEPINKRRSGWLRGSGFGYDRISIYEESLKWLNPYMCYTQYRLRFASTVHGRFHKMKCSFTGNYETWSMLKLVKYVNWSVTVVNCGSLDAPSNGAVDISSGTTLMMTATYTCNTGYTLIGANTRTCGGDGQWTPDAPTCLRTQVISNIKQSMFSLCLLLWAPVVICPISLQ